MEDNKEEVNIDDDTKLVFCIDVSGSMGESHQVVKDGKAGSVTRMKLVVEAVLQQIEQMKISHPNRFTFTFFLSHLIKIERSAW